MIATIHSPAVFALEVGHGKGLLDQAGSNPLLSPSNPGLLDLLSGLLLAVIPTKPASALLLVLVPNVCWVSLAVLHQYAPKPDSDAAYETFKGRVPTGSASMPYYHLHFSLRGTGLVYSSFNNTDGFNSSLPSPPVLSPCL